MKFGVRKLESWGYQVVKKSLLKPYHFLRFDTILARDRETDRRPDIHTYVHKSFIKMMTKRIKLTIRYKIKSI